MSEAMLGVGSLFPARCCWEPEMARLEVFLPLSNRPSPWAGSAGVKASSASRRRFSRSWADTWAGRETSEEEGEGDLGAGRGSGLAELDLRTWTEEGAASEVASLSRHRT